MGHIDSGLGRFLTVMPRTRGEDGWFREHIGTNAVTWQEVHREANPRRRDGPDVVYHGVESPRRSSEGYRVPWYRNSQKAELDARSRRERLQRAYARLEALRGSRRCPFRTPADALEAGQRIVQDEQVQRYLLVTIGRQVREEFRQAGPGRPGPETEYRRVEISTYQPAFEEDAEALGREALCDGLFPQSFQEL